MQFKLRFLFLLGILFIISQAYAQSNYISGNVYDIHDGSPLVGAVVAIKDTSIGTTTDINGYFAIPYEKALPVTVTISFIGFSKMDLVIQSFDKISVSMKPDKVLLKKIEIVDTRISEKQKESALTVESMSISAIKQTPAISFYDGLGHLKGVDLTAASIGFKVVNTRGFNSTSPVRSLQIIDGVDNQAPGLNFSLGNFLGASELDVQKAELIVGASSAFYGPNAFNGVLSMTTKSPFLHPGFSASVKAGERGLVETAIRYAQVIKNKKGESKFGYKLNLYYMKAFDWEATNSDPTPNSLVGKNNPGGYDAVNTYADENTNPYINNASSKDGQVKKPGLGIWHREGYQERDLVDYKTRNIKLGTAFSYKLKEDVELIYSSNFGTGTTVYQGDNRYSLKDILFFQNRLELKKENKYFVRVYATNEDAGKSYDAVFTAILIQDAAKSNIDWSKDYNNYWVKSGIVGKVQALPGFPKYKYPNPYDYAKANEVLALYNDSLKKWHQMARDFANNNVPFKGNSPFPVPGSNAFNEAFKNVTTKRSFSEGGSGLYDKSALYHAHAEYKFDLKKISFTTGANFRLFAPYSEGSIFSDTAGSRIYNTEYGIYAGAERKILEKLKLNFTARMDKNQNFQYLISPAASGVYSFNDKNVLRLSFSSAIRNPTLLDQYLFYNVGRARLIGNLEGVDSLVTLTSLMNFSNSQNPDTLEYFNVARIKPERVKTIEVGYRFILKNLFIDASYYYSYYKDFIGYKIGADLEYDKTYNIPTSIQFLRVASNTSDFVTTQGASVGINYYFRKYYALNGNYSWNELDRHGSNDPLIPAFNTPKNKYNIGFSAKDIEANIPWFGKKSETPSVLRVRKLGFSINYKWVQGFMFEGSPQFTGFVPTYDMVDAQINYHVTKINSTIKIGASNLFDNRRFQVYGGPYIGRMAYVSVLFEPSRK